MRPCASTSSCRRSASNIAIAAGTASTNMEGFYRDQAPEPAIELAHKVPPGVPYLFGRLMPTNDRFGEISRCYPDGAKRPLSAQRDSGRPSCRPCRRVADAGPRRDVNVALEVRIGGGSWRRAPRRRSGADDGDAEVVVADSRADGALLLPKRRTKPVAMFPLRGCATRSPRSASGRASRHRRRMSDRVGNSFAGVWRGETCRRSSRRWTANPWRRGEQMSRP